MGTYFKTSFMTKSISNPLKIAKSLNYQQNRYIALYRTESRPWRLHDLKPEPKEATHFHSLINEHLQNGEVQKAIQFFHALRGRGVTPRLETYKLLIIHFYQTGDYRNIFSAVQELQRIGIPVDIFTLNLVLDICSKNGLIEKTKHIFQEIYHASEGHVNQYALEALLNCYVMREKWSHAIALFAAFKGYGWTVDPDTFEKVKKATLEQAAIAAQSAPKEFKDLFEKNPDTFFQKVCEDGSPQWEEFKQLMQERLDKALQDGTHISIYRGVKINGYEDEFQEKIL